MKLPRLNRLIQLKNKIKLNRLAVLKNKIIPFVLTHRIVILVSMVASFFLVTFGVSAIRARNNFIADMKTVEKNASIKNYISPTPIDLGVLGASDSANDTDVNNNNDAKNVNTYPTSVRIPIITYAPIPTTPPLPTLVPYIAPTSIPDCSGTPTAYNSEAIVSSSNSIVNNPVTITIELLDCHNNYAQVSDNLTIALENSDGTARINGANSPVNIQAQNGKATFTVNSQTNVTDTFIITDTTRSFSVTDPHNHNPSVTFTNSSSGNSNCTTAAGVPNSWYSDVYPTSPQSSTIGTAVTFNVIIRDCGKNTVSSNENLTISLSSGDSSTQVNGNNLPTSLTAQNGQVSFNVNSQTVGTITLTVQDTTSSFGITDTNNHNPSVNFTSFSSPTSTPSPTSTQIDATQAPTQALSQPPNPTATTAPIPTATPKPTPTITSAPVR